MSKKKRAPAKRVNKKKLWITIAVVVVLAVVAVSYFTSPAFQRTKTVGTIGADTVTETEFAYFYQTTVQGIISDIQNTYGDYASLILDTSKSLNEQYYEEDKTWHEYAVERTIEGMQQIHALYHAAEADGYTLTDEGYATIEATKQTIENSAANYGYTTPLYLRAMYGHGMNMKTYEKLLGMVILAEGYATWKDASLTYTDAQIDEYYNAHKADFDTVDLRMVPIQGNTDNESGEVDLTDAKELAEHIMGLYKTEDALAEYAVDIADDDEITAPDDTLYSYIPASKLTPDGMSDWCFDESRAYGDMAVFSDTSAYYVVFYIDRHDIDYNVVSMRHILVKPEQNEDGTVSDEAAAAAIEKMDGYLKEWEASDLTEDTFAAMANQYSEDTGSNTAGGLYTGIYKGQMVKPVNDWLFDPERSVGDVTIVQSSFGYHLMYFAGTGSNYKTTTITETLRTEEYDAWVAGIKADTPVNIRDNVGDLML